MAQHIENNYVTAKSMMTPAQGRVLSCSQLVFWSITMAAACLLANWIALAG